MSKDRAQERATSSSSPMDLANSVRTHDVPVGRPTLARFHVPSRAQTESSLDSDDEYEGEEAMATLTRSARYLNGAEQLTGRRSSVQQTIEEMPINTFQKISIVLPIGTNLAMYLFFRLTYATERDGRETFILFVLLGSSLMCLASSKFFDASSIRERVLMILLIGAISFGTFLLFTIGSSSCFACVSLHSSLDFIEDGVFSDKYDATYGQFTDSFGWQLLTGDKDDIPSRQRCRECVSSLFSMFSLSKHGVEKEARDTGDHVQVTSRHDLIAWYEEASGKMATKDTQQSIETLLTSLSKSGSITDSALFDFGKQYFCSPASRIDNPSVSAYLAAIQNPRFSGEEWEDGLDVSPRQLQGILADEHLRRLGPSLCFMLRFSLGIQEDPGNQMA